MRHCIRGLVLVWVLVGETESGKGGGKTASKVGLAAISQAGSLNSEHGHSTLQAGDIHLDGVNGTLMQNNIMAKLKHDLLLLNGYDKSVRPVRNHTSSVSVEVDFTYIQVLHLNEKDQILKSKLRSRLRWIDQYLSWDPHDYNGIISIRLPATMIWMPDIVCHEEIGNRDYTPRLPYVDITHKGVVNYFEPTSYETSCSVNIAYFPFDYQVCNMTFTSWVFPTSKLDIQAKRTKEDMLKDIPLYFVKTGEWILDDIEVKKMSQSFESLLGAHEDEDEEEHEDHDDVDKIIEQQFFYMNPQKLVKSVAENRHSDLHWSEVQYVYTLRRNSSLYMQSMLFPALLLTTISLLGFYLPPDSGERIGLQITIMLTFMVFLLTVGDMFPASTGPYLGLYFVLCMAMLGLNIAMTVLVLNVHHMPCAAVMRGPNDEGEYYVKMNAVPFWVRASLSLSGLNTELTDFKLTEEDIRGKLNKPKKVALTDKVKPILKKYKSFARSKTLGTIQIEGLDQEKGRVNRGFATTKSLDQLKMEMRNNEFQTGSRVRYRRNFNTEKLEDVEEEQNDLKFKPGKNKNLLKLIGEALGDENDTDANLLRGASQRIQASRQDLADSTKYLRCQYDELKDDKRSEAMQEKWKDIARKLDNVSMHVYIFVLVVLHICMLLAVFIGF